MSSVAIEWVDMPVASAIAGARIRRVYEYWAAVADGAGCDLWQQFDLMALYKEAPFMLVLDHLPDDPSGRLRYRFVGTQIVNYRAGVKPMDQTGLYTRDVPHSYDFSAVLQAYDQVADTAQPVLLKADYQTYNSIGRHERLIVPLTDTEGRVRRLAVCLERLREQPRGPVNRPEQPLRSGADGGAD